MRLHVHLHDAEPASFSWLIEGWDAANGWNFEARYDAVSEAEARRKFKRDYGGKEFSIKRVRLGTRDARFAGTLTGVTTRGKTINVTAAVNAPDHYSAGDKLKEIAASKHGDLRNVVIRWEGGPSRLGSGSVGAKVASMAGAEEE